jgi:hypothetical protein
LYASTFAASDTAQDLPDDVNSVVQDSVGAAVIASEQIRAAGDPGTAAAVIDAANTAFLDGLAAGAYVAAAVTAVGAIIAAVFLPSRPK